MHWKLALSSGVIWMVRDETKVGSGVEKKQKIRVEKEVKTADLF
jgi:hypothetical protein